MYVRVIDNKAESYSTNQLRRDNPNTSFPQEMPDSLLAQYNVYPVQIQPMPTVNEKTHRVRQTEPYNDNGIWKIGYEIVNLPLSEVSEAMRDERNRLLLETDWVVARAYEESNPVPEEWQSYRQNLRDLPQQQGFPYNIVWPTKPA